MKKLILILIIVMTFSGGLIAKKAYADTGQTNITITTYPTIGSTATIPATF